MNEPTTTVIVQHWIEDVENVLKIKKFNDNHNLIFFEIVPL